MWLSRLQNPASIHEDESLISGLTEWVKDPVLPGAVMEVTDRRRSLIAMAVVSANSCSSNLSPSLGTSKGHRGGNKKKKKKKRGLYNYLVIWKNIHTVLNNKAEYQRSLYRINQFV